MPEIRRTILLGMNHDKTHDWYNLYFRCPRGFKYRVTVYEASGIKDLYMCGSIPNLDEATFDSLAYQLGYNEDGSFYTLQQTK